MDIEKIFLLVILSIIFACHPTLEKAGGIELGYRVLDKKESSDQIIKILKTRLEKLDVVNFEIGKEDSLLSIKIPGHQNISRIKQQISGHGIIHICEGFPYEKSNSLLNQVAEKHPEVLPFLDFQPKNKNDLLAYIQPQNIKKIKNILESASNENWPEPFQFVIIKDYRNFGLLYGMKNHANAALEITNEYIILAKTKISEYSGGMELHIKLNEEYKNKWEQLTRKNFRKPLFFLYDFEPYSCPVVMEPITSGDFLISGLQQNREELAVIVNNLQTLPLKSQLQLVSEEVVQPKKDREDI